MNVKKTLWMIPVLFFCACDSNRVFEDNKDLEGNVWPKEELISFEFEIENIEIPYTIYTNIRNASDYPYHNLYYQFSLKDSAGSVLKEELQNINLFDPKTGEPYGSGLGDLFDHRQVLLMNYKFPYRGEYSLSLEQYMRRDTLPLILSLGVRVEKAVE